MKKSSFIRIAIFLLILLATLIFIWVWVGWRWAILANTFIGGYGLIRLHVLEGEGFLGFTSSMKDSYILTPLFMVVLGFPVFAFFCLVKSTKNSR